MQQTHHDWLVPDWPAPPHVHAVCTTRNAGRSTGRFASFNLGDHVGDAPDAVTWNRNCLKEALSVRPVFLNQVHGADVVDLDRSSVDGQAADAAVTAKSGVACTVMVADCLPILLCDRDGAWVGAAHAGWRGLLGNQGQGIVERTVSRLAGGHEVQGVFAWLGPCIGPRQFEVGDEVRAAFAHDSKESEACFAALPNGKWLADLPALARLRLRKAGVTDLFGNDGSDAWCTVSNPSRFFSHRRDRISGRQAACIWRTD